ncbi:hypothetical protein FNF28_02256 [Cafeteria roenbergensis]|uniref:Uncharacterized protein n=1 Tax=Cafeteria roenbergensis TaxID=33653 RepID=A0A5A8DZ91_CAFRO|nr:hypothetical protein FNF28_02256 [Cafeteria roenbergensis]
MGLVSAAAIWSTALSALDEGASALNNPAAAARRADGPAVLAAVLRHTELGGSRDEHAERVRLNDSRRKLRRVVVAVLAEAAERDPVLAIDPAAAVLPLLWHCWHSVLSRLRREATFATEELHSAAEALRSRRAAEGAAAKAEAESSRFVMAGKSARRAVKALRVQCVEGRRTLCAIVGGMHDGGLMLDTPATGALALINACHHPFTLAAMRVVTAAERGCKASGLEALRQLCLLQLDAWLGSLWSAVLDLPSEEPAGKGSAGDGSPERLPSRAQMARAEAVAAQLVPPDKVPPASSGPRASGAATSAPAARAPAEAPSAPAAREEASRLAACGAMRAALQLLAFAAETARRRAAIGTGKSEPPTPRINPLAWVSAAQASGVVAATASLAMGVTSRLLRWSVAARVFAVRQAADPLASGKATAAGAASLAFAMAALPGLTWLSRGGQWAFRAQTIECAEGKGPVAEALETAVRRRDRARTMVATHNKGADAAEHWANVSASLEAPAQELWAAAPSLARARRSFIAEVRDAANGFRETREEDADVDSPRLGRPPARTAAWLAAAEDIDSIWPEMQEQSPPPQTRPPPATPEQPLVVGIALRLQEAAMRLGAVGACPGAAPDSAMELRAAKRAAHAVRYPSLRALFAPPGVQAAPPALALDPATGEVVTAEQLADSLEKSGYFNDEDDDGGDDDEPDPALGEGGWVEDDDADALRAEEEDDEGDGAEADDGEGEERSLCDEEVRRSAASAASDGDRRSDGGCDAADKAERASAVAGVASGPGSRAAGVGGGVIIAMGPGELGFASRRRPSKPLSDGSEAGHTGSARSESPPRRVVVDGDSILARWDKQELEAVAAAVLAGGASLIVCLSSQNTAAARGLTKALPVVGAAIWSVPPGSTERACVFRAVVDGADLVRASPPRRYLAATAPPARRSVLRWLAARLRLVRADALATATAGPEGAVELERFDPYTWRSHAASLTDPCRSESSHCAVPDDRVLVTAYPFGSRDASQLAASSSARFQGAGVFGQPWAVHDSAAQADVPGRQEQERSLMDQLRSLDGEGLGGTEGGEEGGILAVGHGLAEDDDQDVEEGFGGIGDGWDDWPAALGLGSDSRREVGQQPGSEALEEDSSAPAGAITGGAGSGRASPATNARLGGGAGEGANGEEDDDDDDGDLLLAEAAAGPLGIGYLGRTSSLFDAQASGLLGLGGTGAQRSDGRTAPPTAPRTSAAYGAPYGAPTSAAYGAPYGAPTSAAYGAPYGAPTSAAYGAPYGAPTSAAYGAPYGAPTSAAYGAPYGAPTSAAYGAPYGAPTSAAYGGPFAATSGTADGSAPAGGYASPPGLPASAAAGQAVPSSKPALQPGGTDTQESALRPAAPHSS